MVNLRPGHFITGHKLTYPMMIAYRPEDAPSQNQMLPRLELPDTEIFLNQIFTDASRKTVLFGFKTTVDGITYMQDRAGWMMPAGKGWVFYFQPGHFAGGYENTRYAQILVNAVGWRPE
jgi:trehalose utilization protein